MGWNRHVKLGVTLLILFILLPFHSSTAFAQHGSLIPMGHSIGIKMDLSGVFVTNDVMVDNENWLKAGDLIEQVEEYSVRMLDEFENALSSIKGNDITLQVLRNGETSKIQADTGAMKRLIPFLKDRTEGTGTLTYVDPEKMTYGALGHQIIDSALQSPPLFKDGAIYLSEIGQIKKSVPGIPGYKISTIVDNEKFLGKIRRNSVYGIFGTWNDKSRKVLAEPLEIMHANDLKLGEATIYTTVKGTEVESFSIRITKIEKEQFHFIITDSKLLEETGGILQGMSGSPVIQDGKFAGAITHMFVDEPKKGAGLFLETMRNGEQ
ncbi:SpoIVB peptidase S55 domain-containing protein [Sporosarcina sp. 179-K 3D1 HS]|uniref:SpoIVB peptidase S55 domain-containing protein n=1 Tax=Sporosarcina sp. 179-K 3D1 HS TaxID=3232169 RepID=UPI0039A0AE9E